MFSNKIIYLLNFPRIIQIFLANILIFSRAKFIWWKPLQSFSRAPSILFGFLMPKLSMEFFPNILLKLTELISIFLFYPYFTSIPFLPLGLQIHFSPPGWAQFFPSTLAQFPSRSLSVNRPSQPSSTSASPKRRPQMGYSASVRAASILLWSSSQLRVPPAVTTSGESIAATAARFAKSKSTTTVTMSGSTCPVPMAGCAARGPPSPFGWAGRRTARLDLVREHWSKPMAPRYPPQTSCFFPAPLIGDPRLMEHQQDGRPRVVGHGRSSTNFASISHFFMPTLICGRPLRTLFRGDFYFCPAKFWNLVTFTPSPCFFFVFSQLPLMSVWVGLNLTFFKVIGCP